MQANAANPAPAGQPEGGFWVTPAQRQRGRLHSLGAQGAQVTWFMDERVVAIFGAEARQQIVVPLSEVSVTDGLGGDYPARPADILAAEGPVPCQFRLGAKMYVPPEGYPLAVPAGQSFIELTGADGQPILVKAVGRLVCWRGDRGMVKAQGRNGGLMALMARAASCKGPDGLPLAEGAKVVPRQAVMFTARYVPHLCKSVAEQVTRLDGQPLHLEDEEEVEMEDEG